MEALVPAFVAALLTQIGDKPPLLTAILADRYGRPLVVALMAGLAHLAGNLLAAAAARGVAPMLNGDAQALMLAIALVFGGLGGFWPARVPDRLESWRLGPLLTPLLGIFFLALGGQTQFFTFAIGVRGQPLFAAAGAAVGAFLVAFVAAVLGELSWRGIPLRAFRIVVALGFLVAGAIVGLGALHLR